MMIDTGPRVSRFRFGARHLPEAGHRVSRRDALAGPGNRRSLTERSLSVHRITNPRLTRRSLLALTAFLAAARASAGSASTPTAAPAPLRFPLDDGPHDAPIEWWYYTGHLITETGDRYGFEFVVFKARRNGILGYASHFAVADNARSTFHYEQQVALAPSDANTPSGEGFAIRVGEWAMGRGADEFDRLVAAMPGYAMSLDLTSVKPPALHDGDGFIRYENGESTHYYSRTRLQGEGRLTLGEETLEVKAEAWFDHQWGDVSTVIDLGWDWFSVQLDDDTELMLYQMRSGDTALLDTDGTFVAVDGATTALEGGDFTAVPTGSWTSPASGAIYPSGWRIEAPSLGLALELTPSLLDQELITTASTGETYWEGEVTVTGTREGKTVSGLGYVELTGYAP
jgi:predicted secreted hydrolase